MILCCHLKSFAVVWFWIFVHFGSEERIIFQLYIATDVEAVESNMKMLDKIDYESWVIWKINLRCILTLHGLDFALWIDEPPEPTDISSLLIEIEFWLSQNSCPIFSPIEIYSRFIILAAVGRSWSLDLCVHLLAILNFEH